MFTLKHPFYLSDLKERQWFYQHFLAPICGESKCLIDNTLSVSKSNSFRLLQLGELSLSAYIFSKNSQEIPKFEKISTKVLLLTSYFYTVWISKYEKFFDKNVLCGPIIQIFFPKTKNCPITLQTIQSKNLTFFPKHVHNLSQEIIYNFYS